MTDVINLVALVAFVLALCWRLDKIRRGSGGLQAIAMAAGRIVVDGNELSDDVRALDAIRRENPAALPSASWDARRMWLTAYKEEDRAVRVTGVARDGEDVSELLRRLALSDMFYEVKLLPATRTQDERTKLDMVKFDLSAKVRY